MSSVRISQGSRYLKDIVVEISNRQELRSRTQERMAES